MLDVDLMADADRRRDDAEIAEAGLRQFEEGIAFPVARVFDLQIPGEGVLPPEDVDSDRMIDDEVDRRQRIDVGRIAAQPGNGVARSEEHTSAPVTNAHL